MGLLDFIFGKTPKIEHAFFGTMTFLEQKAKSGKGHFECRRHFAPTDAIIEIGIEGDAAGPTDTQVKFFQSIESNYDQVTASIIPLIEDEFGNWKEGFRIADFRKEFKAVYLNLPRCEETPISWEIAFETHHDQNHTFTLAMSDFDAVHIQIDG